MGEGSYSFWVAIMFIWGLAAGITVIVFPAYELFLHFTKDANAAKTDGKDIKIKFLAVAQIRKEREEREEEMRLNREREEREEREFEERDRLTKELEESKRE